MMPLDAPHWSASFSKRPGASAGNALIPACDILSLHASACESGMRRRKA